MKKYKFIDILQLDWYSECQEQHQTLLQDHDVEHCVLFTTWTLVSRYKASLFVQRPWLVWMWFIGDDSVV